MVVSDLKAQLRPRFLHGTLNKMAVVKVYAVRLVDDDQTGCSSSDKFDELVALSSKICQNCLYSLDSSLP